MTSLRRQLSWGLMLSLTALLILQWAMATYVINSLIEEQMIARMRHEGESLLAGVQLGASETLVVDAKYISNAYQRPFSGHYYVVTTDQQSMTSRSLWDVDIPVERLNQGEQHTTFLEGPEQQPLLVISSGYKKHGHLITITIAENLAPIKKNMKQFQLIYASLSLFGLFALLLIQRWIIVDTLKPLQQVKDSISKLISGESQKIVSDGPEEVSPLIEEFNRTLVSVQNKSKRSRESLGNLAHALKSKLTLLNQVAEHQSLSQLPALRQQIYAVTESINHHIERELKKARLMGNIHPAKRVNLPTEISQLVNTLQHIYSKKAVNITWQIAPDASFDGDREDLLELLGNLLDNACKWCEHQVCLTVIRDKVITFIVEDDGSGCAEEKLAMLVQRGFRADESTPGSGLGLAIANDIAQSYDASLTFSHSTRLGGLCVTVSFPLH